mmetsp:Transcript_79680/g.258121  ORF Transcript_79680/g.258121 Transcript_79680/m.258121 type:complete len:447 (-) Transcript_79680:236-1576(-)
MVCVLVHDDLEGLDASCGHLHLGPVDVLAAPGVRVHGGEAPIGPLAVHVVLPSEGAAQALEGFGALLLEVGSHGDVAVPHLQLHRHLLAGLSDDPPVLAVAPVVRPPDRHVSCQGLVLCGIDGLVLVPVPQEVELLVAREADPEDKLVHARLAVLQLPHCHGPEAVHGGNDAVGVPVLDAGGKAQGAFVQGRLPRDPLLPRLWVPGEDDHVDGVLLGLFPAVDGPAVALWSLAGAEHRGLRVRHLARGEDDGVVEPVADDLELLHLGLAHGEGEDVAALVLKVVHALHGGETVEGALEIEGVLGVEGVAREVVAREVLPVLQLEARLDTRLRDARVEELRAAEDAVAAQVPGRLARLRVPGPRQAAAPDVASGVRAAEAEGGDAVEALILALVHELGAEVHGVGVAVDVGVQQPHVDVGRRGALHAHEDALHDAQDAGAHLRVAEV